MGCSTSKKKAPEDVRGLGKAMHNLNARFNGYHNAKVILNESFANLSKQHQDNYNQILSLYREAAVEDAQSASSQLDEAIKKTSIVISLHRGSKWTDNSYMVIGQSQYLKQEYDDAEETFKYVTAEYEPKNLYEKELKRLKRKKKKSVKRLKGEELEEELAKKKYQRNERRNAMIWLARTNIEQEKYEDAQFMINKLQKDDKLNKRQQAALAAVNAYAKLKQLDYANSIEPLKVAIDLTKRKRKKNRYVYILAQIYQMQGQDELAAAAYRDVLRMRPEYDMEFRTRLNMVTNEWSSGKSDSKSALASLKRMSKDLKNEEFRDQIYFAMSTVAIKENMNTEAMGFLKKSLFYNVNNKPQKAESYLRLAEIYFNKESYVSSKNYYDSTLVVLPTNDARYEEVSNYALTLTDIAKNIEILALNDSLLMIKNMNEDDKLALAKKIKKEGIDSESAKESGKPKGKTGASNSLPSPSSQKSNFFAFDDNLVKKGKRDFDKQWGDRKLEDNWRRAVRNTQIASAEEGEVEELASISVSEAEMKEMFKDVPQTEEDMKKMDEQNIESLFALGNLYRDRLDNTKKSIATFEDLLKRYPDNKHNLESMYSLYLLYDDANDRAKANYYKDQVLKKYPDSRHAQMIKNPGSVADIQDSDKQVNKYYNQAYTLYENGGYQEAISKIEGAEKAFGDANSIRPKFALLLALCTGNVNGRDAYVAGLGEVITKYPDTDEARKAQEFLALIGASASTKPKELAGNPKNGRNKKDLFKIAEGDQHYVIIVLSNQKVKTDKAKTAISDYNKKYHELENLKISSLMLDLETSILIVRRFSNQEKGLKYSNEVTGKKPEFLKNLDNDATIYPLSQTNYKTLLRIREMAPYLEFCAENY